MKFYQIYLQNLLQNLQNIIKTDVYLTPDINLDCVSVFGCLITLNLLLKNYFFNPIITYFSRLRDASNMISAVVTLVLILSKSSHSTSSAVLNSCPIDGGG